MRVAVRSEPYKITIEERPEPEAGAGQVLLRVYDVGVCGGDLHYFRGSPGLQFTPQSLVMGHEAAGRIEAVGPGVKGLAVGDRVVIDPQVGWCGKCRYCEKGWRSLCAQRTDMGYVVDGACADVIAIAGELCYRLPDSVTWTQAANVHGLAAVLRGIDRVPFQPDATVLIQGPGPAGLLFAQVAKRIRGAGQVILAGRSDHRLKVGLELGADRVVNTRAEDVGEVVRGLTDGEGADLIVDTTGSPQAQQEAIDVLRKRGNFLAYSRGRLDVDLQVVLKRDHTIYGSTGVHGYLIPAIEAIRSGRIQVDPLITHVYPLERTQDAFDRAVAEAKGDYIKGVIRVTEES